MEEKIRITADCRPDPDVADRPYGASSSLCARIRPALSILLLFTLQLEARKFYPDDPIQREPAPVDVKGLKPRRINQWYDYYRNTFGDPGEGNEDPGGPFPAQSVNTLGEVLDGAWYQNRKLTHEQIVNGPGEGRQAPDMSAPWEITSAKSEGVTPGFVVRDAKGRRYVLKFDPIENLEMATSADVIGGRLFHALGYWAPENHIVVFPREHLMIREGTQFTDRFGRRRPLSERDVAELLLDVPRIQHGPNKGKIRAVASLYVPGQPIGPFKYYGRRQGDTNDFIRHEHRRELRGLHVIAAWLNHHDARAINTLDTVIEENGIHYVRHYLIDFGSTLGSAAIKPKSAREGNAYLYDFREAALNFATLGLYPRDWELAKYRYHANIGRIQWEAFDAEEWVPNYYNRAFRNRLPDDTYWAAKKIMQLTDEDIRDVVATGQISDKQAEAWLAEWLIKRRDIIGRHYFTRGLPLDHFTVRDGRLTFEDLAVRYKFVPSRQYRHSWFRFNNETEQRTSLGASDTAALPDEVRSAEAATYWGCVITGGDTSTSVTVYLRRTNDGHQVVGIERTW